MPRPVTEQQQANRAEQVRHYGAPLGELMRGVMGDLAISQARLAELLGLSAPMVSQLASAHRVKIGNPAAVVRLQRLIALGAEVRSGRTDATSGLHEFASEQDESILTTTQLSRRQGAAEVQALLRSVAPAVDLLAAADRLEPDFPALAEVLRVYGAGRSDEAARHFARTVPL